LTLLLILGAAVAGFVFGWVIKPTPDRFLRWSRGPVPYWRADAVAEQVALNLALLRPTRKEMGELVELARKLRVVFVPGSFQAHEPWKRGLDGIAVWTRVIYVQAGPGWELRLAEGISQHLRRTVLGELDPHGQDKVWREAALTGLVAPAEDHDHPAGDQAGQAARG